MRIRRFCYPIRVLGPGERLGIWVTGCSFHCPGCMSPELQDPAAGREISCEELIAAAKKAPGPIDGVTISGGEPFDQPEQLHLVVDELCRQITTDIIIYSGYTLAQLRARNCPDTDAVLNSIALLIDGRYMEDLDDGIGLRGSSNQHLHIFRNPERYAYMADCKRELQIFNYNNAASLMVGLL